MHLHFINGQDNVFNSIGLHLDILKAVIVPTDHLIFNWHEAASVKLVYSFRLELKVDSLGERTLQDHSTFPLGRHILFLVYFKELVLRPEVSEAEADVP